MALPQLLARHHRRGRPKRGDVGLGLAQAAALDDDPAERGLLRAGRRTVKSRQCGQGACLQQLPPLAFAV